MGRRYLTAVAPPDYIVELSRDELLAMAEREHCIQKEMEETT